MIIKKNNSNNDENPNQDESPQVDNNENNQNREIQSVNNFERCAMVFRQ